MLFNGPKTEGGPITNASDSAGTVDAGQTHPSRARLVGGFFAAIGASVCILAGAWLTASLRSPAKRIATAGDASIPATLSRPEPIPTPIPDTERRINEVLAKPFSAASRPEKMTFREAIDRIGKLLPVPVDLDSKALADANIDTSVEVEFPTGQRTVGEVLDYLLSSLAASLDWTVLHGSLTITTVDMGFERTDMRVYDVTDLVEPAVTPNGVETWDTEQLMEAIRMSSPLLANGEDNLSPLSANGRTLLVARVHRRAHQDLASALAKMRALAFAGPQSISPRPRRRVVQSAKPKASPPRIASEADVAALQSLMMPATDSAVLAADASCNAFAFEFYRRLHTAPGNRAVCPYGIYVALALLKEGAAGEVEQQIAHVLHATRSPDETRALLTGLSNRLEAINLVPEYELSIQSRVWYDHGVPVPPELAAALRDHYHVEMDGVPFLTQPSDAEASINNWVKNATGGRIGTIITVPEIVSSGIDFAVTNAVLFRGLWAKPFDRKKSVQAPFHAGGKAFDVVMMRGEKEEAPLGESAGSQILERPYRGGLLSALILLPPDAPGALERLEASLSVEKLKEWRSALRSCQVKVELPRFEIESDFHLEEPLKTLGMPRAFVPTADFSKLGRSEWRLTYLRQKALLKVNEEGTEATAASMMAGGFGAPKEHLFRADRPFLFLIQEKSTGLILFVARVTDPNRGV
ncbi:MAG TPA: serpin family protein [Planctomycetaceae bacterium]|jgi:serpin B|nr:serpin family protein [Planctomycetaceae bacterium]